MNKQSYAIIGTGAVGGLYGSRLQQAGHDVHFLARGDYDHIKQHGLKVESPWGGYRAPLRFSPPTRVRHTSLQCRLRLPENDQQLSIARAARTTGSSRHGHPTHAKRIRRRRGNGRYLS